jgi:ribosomal protein S18 acetylase RimI-like enzyme
VSTDNGRAIGFYSSYGFRPADERRPMTTDETVEEVAMTLPLA